MGLSQQIGASSLIKPGVIDSAAQRPASPYEGQVIFQKDTDQMLVWNGAAWVIPNAPAQNPTGLELVKTQTIGTAVASVSVNNCFSSAYNNYRVIIRIAGASTANDCNLRYRVGGVDDTALAYSWFYVGINNTAGSLNNASGGQSLAFTGTNVSTTGIVQTFELDFLSPFLTEEKRTFGFGSQRAPGGMRVGGTVFTNATSFDGFTLLASAGSYTGGTITVYGYREG